MRQPDRRIAPEIVTAGRDPVEMAVAIPD